MVSVKARAGKLLRVAKMTVTDQPVEVVHGPEVRDHLRHGRLLLASATGPEGHRAKLDEKVMKARAKATGADVPKKAEE